jgi:uroporphyrinogen decarboxylase
MSLTSHERIARILKRQPVDRVGLYESFWPETQPAWAAAGHLRPDESPCDHFGLDIRECWAFNTVADLDFREEILEETPETKLVRDGNGAVLRRHKLHSSTPEHVDFLVQDRAGWEQYIRPRLTDESVYRRRIRWDDYRYVRQLCRDRQLFFLWSGVNVFELMHPVCGHEHMLIGMADDPDWVKDMCSVFAELTIRLMEILFDEAGPPDGVWFYEDMGFKGRPFMSPAMYRDILWPAHRHTIDFAHALEVKAGMDLVRLKQAYGDRIAFMGGLDVRPLVANDRRAIQAELDAKLPAAMAGGGYCLHSDHSIPSQVAYETYKFFVQRGLEMGTY